MEDSNLYAVTARACAFIASETVTRDSSCISTYQSCREGFRGHHHFGASVESGTASQIRANNKQSKQKYPSRFITCRGSKYRQGLQPKLGRAIPVMSLQIYPSHVKYAPGAFMLELKAMPYNLRLVSYHTVVTESSFQELLYH